MATIPTIFRPVIRNTFFYLTLLYYSCKYDYIDVYVQLSSLDESLLEAPVLGRFCGDSLHNLPKLIISTHNIIVIVFFSDNEKNDAGFEGAFAFIDACKYRPFLFHYIYHPYQLKHEILRNLPDQHWYRWFEIVLSYDVASGSEITPFNKIDKALVVYGFSRPYQRCVKK